MAEARKPFQGIWNIVRFNWHFYVSAAFAVVIALLSASFLPQAIGSILQVLAVAIVIAIAVSLLISFYVYDLSGLYRLNWLDQVRIASTGNAINVTAGFDETSAILSERFPNVSFRTFDFYNPKRHTEVAIKRARRVYPAYKGTLNTSTAHLPLPNNYCNSSFAIFAAHEIREESERTEFLCELHRTLDNEGKIVIVEHLRDAANLFAFSLGVFHFIPRASWLRSFADADLRIMHERKLALFVTLFILEKNGASS